MEEGKDIHQRPEAFMGASADSQGKDKQLMSRYFSWDELLNLQMLLPENHGFPTSIKIRIRDLRIGPTVSCFVTWKPY